MDELITYGPSLVLACIGLWVAHGLARKDRLVEQALWQRRADQEDLLYARIPPPPPPPPPPRSLPLVFTYWFIGRLLLDGRTSVKQRALKYVIVLKYGSHISVIPTGDPTLHVKMAITEDEVQR